MTLTLRVRAIDEVDEVMRPCSEAEQPHGRFVRLTVDIARRVYPVGDGGRSVTVRLLNHLASLQ
jgi:hypothetical protein